MTIETIIYAYLAICISMIGFNCICILIFRNRKVRMEHSTKGLYEKIERQIERMEAGLEISNGHKIYMRFILKRANGMLAFDETLMELKKDYPEAMELYLKEIYSVFVDICMSHPYRDTTKAAYFAYIIGKHEVLKGKRYSIVIDHLLLMLRSSSLYCRENALYAIFQYGDKQCVLKALKILDENEQFHHQKLLEDGLLAYGGNHQELCEILWKSFSDFSVFMRVVILNYFRFKGIGNYQKILQRLVDTREDDEVRFACIRYFGRHRYEPAYPVLLEFAEHSENYRWEYAAISAQALGLYPYEHTIEVLKEKLHHSNWYIRVNASESLEKFNLTYTDLLDIFDSNDRYAREIMQYRMDLKKARMEQEV